jgi:putative membrane protein
MNIKKITLASLSVLFFAIGVVMSFIPPEKFVEIGSIIAVTMIAAPAFYAMIKIFGRRGVLAIVALGLFAMTIETIGIYTGFPYSPFQYTMPFGYKLFGSTPWTVFIAWSPLVIGAFLLAQNWFQQNWSQFFAYLGLLIGTDIILDPGAVARGLWKYSEGGLWFEVPLQNFMGWIISGTIAYVILKLIFKKSCIPRQAEDCSINSVVARDEAISETQGEQIAALPLAMTDFGTKYLWIGSLSLVLSIFLWSGVNAGYELCLPAILGIILGNILIFGLFDSIKKPSQM